MKQKPFNQISRLSYSSKSYFLHLTNHYFSVFLSFHHKVNKSKELENFSKILVISILNVSWYDWLNTFFQIYFLWLTILKHLHSFSVYLNQYFYVSSNKSNYSIEIFYELSQYSDYHKRYPKDIQKWKPYFQILHNHIPVYSMISDQPNSTSSIGNIIQESIESIYLIKYLHFF